MDSLQFGWQDLHFLTILDEETRRSFFRGSLMLVYCRNGWSFYFY
ncbi:hypothetical protein D932_02799 [Enterococcus casseliflavus 14-MB-W-14]|nr:hypothetical protein D932_02799 [Enterococcus casseliflavus 14-MB-W-14]